MNTVLKSKPWCNYSVFRTVSHRRAAGARRNKRVPGVSKRREQKATQAWWTQATGWRACQGPCQCRAQCQGPCHCLCLCPVRDVSWP